MRRAAGIAGRLLDACGMLQGGRKTGIGGMQFGEKAV
jgi:hypothetical protein